MAERLEGRNPVLEALKSGRTIEKIVLAKGEKHGSVRKIIQLAKEKGIIIQEAEKKKLDFITKSANHQGVIAYVAAHSYVAVEDILALAEERGEDPFVLVLDGIEDPHNLGSIIRSADGAGVHGIIIPERRAVGLTAAVAKTSAGAIEHLAVAKVTNIGRTIELLQAKGLWIAGADMQGKLYTEADLTGPLALVIGNEGKGISRLVKEKTDFLLRIPMRGQVNSLNASVAAALFMYEAVRQRGK